MASSVDLPLSGIAGLRIMQTGVLRSLFILIAGAIFPLALAPLFWWPIGLLSLAGFSLALLTSTSTRSAFFRSWLFSFGQFGTGVSWIYVSMHDYGGTSALLSTLLVASFAAALALVPALIFSIWKAWFANKLPWLTLIVFWFLSEWTRSWLLTGFPWLFAGDGHLNTWLSGWAPIIGSYGISLILMLSATTCLMGIRHKQWRWALPWLLWPLGWLLQPLEWTQTTGNIQVSAVQGNVDQNEKWKPEMIGPTIQLYLEETDKLWNSDLIVWPETAITLLHNRFLPYLEDLGAKGQETDTAIITGIPFRYPQGHDLAGELHNSIVATGTGQGIYHKQRLVPMGEYVPLESYIRGLIPFFDLEMSSFLPGRADQPLLIAETNETLYSIAPYICYEIAYPQLVADMAKMSNLLITVSNDAWFGDSLGPKQHMALAQMRALETGRYLLRATNTGITALVDDKGYFVERMEAGIRGAITGQAELKSGSTPYMLAGLLPHYLLSLMVLGFCLLQQITQRQPLDS
jgi:apolipoprotein N-acyltransferase